MHNHHTKVIHFADDGGWQGRCTCRKWSPLCEHKWQAEDWNTAHLGEVERIKAYLAGAPSLVQERDYFLQRENDPATPEADRLLWRQLRIELDHRLGTTEVRDDPLW